MSGSYVAEKSRKEHPRLREELWGRRGGEYKELERHCVCTEGVRGSRAGPEPEDPAKDHT